MRELSDEAARDILQDIHMLRDMHKITVKEVREYLEDSDSPPHLPNALYVHCELVYSAIQAAHLDRRNTDERVGHITRDLLVHLFLTGVQMGKAGISMRDLGACDCHKPEDGAMSDESLAAFIKESVEKLGDS